MNIETHSFHVVGMHCKSCVMLTESEISQHPSVSSVRANLADCTVDITGDFRDKERELLVRELGKLIEKHGYSLTLEKVANKDKWKDFKIAIPLSLVIVMAFYFLQKAGLVNLVKTDSLNYGAAFFIGIIASLSSCMAVVGGLLLSMSASYAKGGEEVRPQLMFHFGRLVSFFILGGVIGTIGSTFTLSPSASFILGILIALVMLTMGLNLLNIFSWTRKILPSMPKFISKSVLNNTSTSYVLMPLLVGVATFFLPCGFTQAMQIYTLSTGNFLAGGLTMLFFALGTMPILALVSFSSFSITKSAKAGVFFKTAGLIVIVFAIFNLLNSLAVIGIINPIFNF